MGSVGGASALLRNESPLSYSPVCVRRPKGKKFIVRRRSEWRARRKQKGEVVHLKTREMQEHKILACIALHGTVCRLLSTGIRSAEPPSILGALSWAASAMNSLQRASDVVGTEINLFCTSKTACIKSAGEPQKKTTERPRDPSPLQLLVDVGSGGVELLLRSLGLLVGLVQQLFGEALSGAGRVL